MRNFPPLSIIGTSRLIVWNAVRTVFEWYSRASMRPWTLIPDGKAGIGIPIVFSDIDPDTSHRLDFVGKLFDVDQLARLRGEDLDQCETSNR